MKKRYLIKSFAAMLLLLTYNMVAQAQLSMTAQYRSRSEYRSGQGTLPLKGDAPSFFTSQRMRIGIGYNMDRLKFFASIQDIRDWGQDGSTISNADGKNLMVHEAWSEIIFSDSSWSKIADNFSLKIGRQEIVYDDSRLLGNLDWLQQARRHDAAILKWNKRYWFADLGVAYNQNRETKSSAFYDGTATNPNFTGAVNGSNGLTPNYKAFYYLYVRRNLGWGNASLLSFNDDFAKGPNGTSLGFSNAVYSRHTNGVNLSGKALRKIDFNAYGYYQSGKDNKGNKLSAYTYGAGFMALVSRKFSVGPGFDLMSGNNTVKSQYYIDGQSNNQAFDPLYGTPHKFWGYMDYFYVADGYANYKPNSTGLGNSSSSILSPGLVNAFLKVRYKLAEKVTLSLDAHEFWAQNKVANRSTTTDTTDVLNKNLGTELDFLLSWNLTPAINIEGGYSAMFGTNTLKAMKHSGATGSASEANRNTLTRADIGQWAYVMINIRPDLMADLNIFKRDHSRKLDEMSKKLDELSNKVEGAGN
jgi:hypothetical protein